MRITLFPDPADWFPRNLVAKTGCLFAHTRQTCLTDWCEIYLASGARALGPRRHSSDTLEFSLDVCINTVQVSIRSRVTRPEI